MTAAAAPSAEDVIDQLVAALRSAGSLPAAANPVPWDEFGHQARAIHSTFTVDHTTLTPPMRRLLFAIGATSGLSRLLVVGSFVGYATAFLIAGMLMNGVVDAVCIDPDASANASARRNLGSLWPGTAAVVDGFAPVDLPELMPVPMLVLLDLDDPETGKAGYASVVEALAPTLQAGSLVLAHDAAVPRFAADIDAFHEALVGTGTTGTPLVLPVDACGISLTAVLR